jgi:uncharacterized protein (DUF433 family)
MTNKANPQPTVIRTSRGLSIAGRRLTLYSIMDYLQAGWPPHLVRDEFNFTDNQMADVLSYIETYRDEVEQEYQAVLQHAKETRQYWEERNRERRKHLAYMPPKPGQEEIRASNSQSILKILYNLCRKTLSAPFRAPCIAFDATCTARIEARRELPQLWVSMKAEFHHGHGTRGPTCLEWRGS